MSYRPSRLLWHNGRFVPWEQATTHVLAHGLHYGSSVFEGLRCYDTPRGPAIFRLAAHVRRLFDSARIYGLELPWSEADLRTACADAIQVNGLRAAYLRPIAFRGAGSFSLAPGTSVPIEVAVAAIEWGTYLGETALRDGVDACVSSWTRLAPNTVPVLAKAGGHYLSSQLVAAEAARHGYAEGIALDAAGHLSEGSGENVFLVRDGLLYTPPVAGSVLQGITRDSVLALAADLGLQVKEQVLPREALYLADEVFFTGTAVEITPVRSIDRLVVGDGTPGPITRAIQRSFFGLFDGSTPDSLDWLDLVARHASPEDPSAPFPASEDTLAVGRIP
jgi:branched-chain amino acid aminotransferase